MVFYWKRWPHEHPVGKSGTPEVLLQIKIFRLIFRGFPSGC